MLSMEFDNHYTVLLDYPDIEEKPQDPKPTLEIPPSVSPNEHRSRAGEPAANWWSFAYYRQFFDVTTDDVLSRLASSVKFLHSKDFLTLIQDKPDLYGPIWICLMLSLETAVVSDAAYLLQQDKARYWRQTFKTGYQSFVLLFLYCWCLPTMIWIGLEWNPVSEVRFRLLELWCLYGYAMAIFSPVMTLWALPLNWTRWLSCTAAATISGIVINRALKKAFCQLDRSGYYTIQLLLFFLNLLIDFSFIVLFFPSRHENQEPEISPYKFVVELLNRTTGAQFNVSVSNILKETLLAKSMTQLTTAPTHSIRISPIL